MKLAEAVSLSFRESVLLGLSPDPAGKQGGRQALCRQALGRQAGWPWIGRQTWVGRQVLGRQTGRHGQAGPGQADRCWQAGR